MNASPVLIWLRRGAILLATALLAAGCATPNPHDLVLGPSYQPRNISGANRPLPRTLRRVAVLPLNIGHNELSAGRETLEPVLRDEFGKAKRFELVCIKPAQLRAWTGRDTLSTAEPLPLELLHRVREELGCEGVLFPELTQFNAYPPLVVGWNLKLVEAQSGQTLWAADEVFDAGQPTVVDGARRYQLRHSQIGGQLSDSRFILLSPSAFGHYSAETLFALLPPESSAKDSPSNADKHQ